MKPMTPARRRAEDFHTQVENAATRGGDARFDELLSVVATLREAPQPEARPEFVSDLRRWSDVLRVGRGRRRAGRDRHEGDKARGHAHDRSRYRSHRCCVQTGRRQYRTPYHQPQSGR